MAELGGLSLVNVETLGIYGDIGSICCIVGILDMFVCQPYNYDIGNMLVYWVLCGDITYIWGKCINEMTGYIW